jgi:hypothetical protein
MQRLLTASAFLLGCVTCASAQTIVVNPNRTSMPMTAEQVRVTLNVNTFLPALNDTGEDALKAQEAGRRMIYALAAHECDILRDTIASECRLESINVNVQRMPNQFGPQRVEGFNVNANISYRVLQK